MSAILQISVPYKHYKLYIDINVKGQLSHFRPQPDGNLSVEQQWNGFGDALGILGVCFWMG